MVSTSKGHCNKRYKANQNEMFSSGILGNINTLMNDNHRVIVHYNIVFNIRYIYIYIMYMGNYFKW